MDKLNPNTQIWMSFLQECEEMMEKETGKKYMWEDIYPTNTQKLKILDELFIKHASLPNIILRSRVIKDK